MRNNILGRGEQVTSAGVQNYNFTFPIESQNDIAVYLGSTLLNPNFDYVVSGAGSASGFTIQLVNDPGANLNLIALLAVPLAQTLDLIRSGGIPADSIEDKLDLIMEALQMFAERWLRTIRLNEYSMDENIIAPDYSAGKWWKYDDTVRKITLADPPSGAPGLQGPAGPGILFGSGVPGGSLGTVNATYIDTASGDVYSKTDATTWTLAGNIKGPKGDPGDDGVSTTVGAAKIGPINVTAGDLQSVIDLTTLALADANYACVAIPSWQTETTVTIDSATQVTLDYTAAAPNSANVRLIIVAQGAIGGGSGGSGTLIGHDHTEAAGDGGVLTRDVHDAYAEFNAFSDANVGTVPAAKSRIWFNGSGWFQKIASSVLPLGYFTHSHSPATPGDGGPLVNPQIDNYFDLKLVAAPATPVSGYWRFYKDVSDGHFKAKSNAGVVVDFESAVAASTQGTYGVRGLVGQNNAISPLTSFDIAADVWCVRNSANQVIVLHSPGSKTVNIGAVGAGGRDQATAFSSGNWIYIYGIYNGAVSALLASLSTPPTGPTLPTGYTHWNFLTAIRLGSSGLVSCQARGDWVSYDLPQNILTGGSSTTQSAVGISTVVPTKAMRFELLTTIRATSNDDQADTIPSLILRLVSSGANYRTLIPRSDVGMNRVRANNTIIAPYVGSSVFYLLNDNATSNGSPRVDLDVAGYQIPNE